ncbi:MAG TPA: oligoendopeptidase F [Chloroflexia bacterium]|nr:oligoendopeptidase F [Chloroflexia bacterium]
MATATLPSRADIETEHKWHLEAIYSEDTQWEEHFNEVHPMIQEFGSYKGRLGESAATLLAAIGLRDNLGQRMDRLYAYARMRRDEDNTNAHYQALEDRTRALWARVEEATSFFNPELLEVGQEQVEGFMQESEGLKLYAHLFDDLFREKEHMLSGPEEAILAAASDMAGGANQIYDMLTEADLKYGNITDEDGREIELTHGRYLRYIRSADRRVRQDVFHKLLGAYQRYRNTIAASYSTQVKTDIFYARTRKYNSALEAALFKDNIPVSVYENLISAVHDKMHLMDRYMALRKRILGVDELHMYDLHVPLVPEVDASIQYGKAVEMVEEALSPLGEEYSAAAKGGFRSRWTDVYETPNKSSGAYSWGVYGVHPFMLLNYQDTLYDVFTLAHEMGHSMHTYYSFANQPYIYSNYTLFVAEVASTLNEELLGHYLLHNTDDKAVKLAVVNHSLEQFRTTLYRQTMFAEFEKIAHERAEGGESLTADLLSEIHYDLNVRYHGRNVEVDKEIAIEWARIPHFYRSFYVYKYATGISAAVALSQQILNEGQPAVDRYLKFLSSGGSDYSVNLLRDAGVDVASPSPVNQALELFEKRLGEMEELLGVTND